MKKVIAFDLDDTLAITQSPISPEMKELLSKLLDHYEICVISGGRFEQFLIQVVNPLEPTPERAARLHLLPTCGTRYYRYDPNTNDWELQYSYDLNAEQKQRISKTLECVSKEMGLWCENPAGEIIEDRYSQMTLSALGQQANPEDKYAWAEKYKEERKVFRNKVAQQLPDLEVRIGGTTSTDITLPGIDKAYGMRKLLEITGLNKEDILFIGDKLQPGGNDYPVKAMGIDSIEVSRWEDTARVLEKILENTKG